MNEWHNRDRKGWWKVCSYLDQKQTGNCGEPWSFTSWKDSTHKNGSIVKPTPGLLMSIKLYKLTKYTYTKQPHEATYIYQTLKLYKLKRKKMIILRLSSLVRIRNRWFFLYYWFGNVNYHKHLRKETIKNVWKLLNTSSRHQLLVWVGRRCQNSKCSEV